MFEEDVNLLLPVLSFHLSCVDCFLYGVYETFHFAIGFRLEGCNTLMFNFVVFCVAGKFVAVEGWTVVCFQDVGISEYTKYCVHFMYHFQCC